MGLHPQADALVKAIESMGLPSFEGLSVEDGRRIMKGFSLVMIPAEEVASVTDHCLPGPAGDIPVRVYTPAAGAPPRPVLLYFHGGGFSTGDVELVDPICRALANRAGCVVVSVAYRLGPEHPYPAAPEDAYAATAWVAAGGAELGVDPTRLAVAGDSAGGNLAAVVSLMARDRGGPEIALQILVYPVTDLTPETAAQKERAAGYLLTADMMRWFQANYLSGVAESAAAEAYCSPLRATDLAHLPPAVIVTAEFDPLRDEGEAYGARLAEAGVAVDVRREAGMVHAFFWAGAAIDRGREIIDELAVDLIKAWSG